MHRDPGTMMVPSGSRVTYVVVVRSDHCGVIGRSPHCEAHDGRHGLQFDSGGQRAINQDPSASEGHTSPATGRVRSISSTTAAASASSADATVTGSAVGGVTTPVMKTFTLDTSSSSRPTIAAAACGVSPALTSDPRALEVPTISPALRFGELEGGGGV